MAVAVFQQFAYGIIREGVAEVCLKFFCSGLTFLCLNPSVEGSRGITSGLVQQLYAFMQ